MSDDAHKTQSAKEAAFWFARLRSERAGSRERRRFERWLNGSADNERNYEAAAAAWDIAGDAASDEAVLAMRRQALAAAPPAAGRRRWQYGAMAASLLLVVCTSLILYPKLTTAPSGASDAPPSRLAYETAVGQRSTISLPDGSVVDLNTDTLIEVQYARGERRIVLHHGEALFDVARDEQRPFVVAAGSHLITAHGTSFDVRRSGENVKVTLLEGKVTVEREEGVLDYFSEPDVKALEPGDQLVAFGDQPFQVLNPDVRRVVSWRDGLLIFVDEPLRDVVLEMNRYSVRKVVLGAEDMKDLRVGGVFRSGSVDGFTAALESAFPLTSRFDESRNVVVLEWDEQAPDQRSD